MKRPSFFILILLMALPLVASCGGPKLAAVPASLQADTGETTAFDPERVNPESDFVALSNIGEAELQLARGQVFVDANGDGLRQLDELGIHGALVSDGIQIVETDSNGHYEISLGLESEFVFVITPTGYEQPGSFYHRISDLEGAEADFALTIDGMQGDDFSFVYFTDPSYPVSEKAINNLKAFVREVNLLENEPEFVIAGGDLVAIDGSRPRESARQFRGYLRGVSGLNVPLYNVMGNHDISFRCDCPDRPGWRKEPFK